MSEADLTAPTFYIPALGSGVERSRISKHGDTFAVFDLLGDLPGQQRGVEGIYHRDTRRLHSLHLKLDGRTPLLLSSHVQRNNALLNVDLTNPDYWHDGHLLLPRDTVHLARMKFLRENGAYEILTLRNFGNRRLRITVDLEFGADFRDILEVRGLRRERQGTREDSVEGNCRVWLRYHGLDRRARLTRIDFHPAPVKLSAVSTRFIFELAPAQRVRIGVVVRRSSDGRDVPAGVPLAVGVRKAHRARVVASKRFPTITTGDELFNEWLCRSTADLVMLTTDNPYGPYPYAGIPWFSTVFGRDGLLTAFQVLWANPDYALGALRFLEAYQGDTHDPEHAAELGKILHELRQGEMANTGEIPFGAYYGSVDATPLFVWLAAEYSQRTGNLAAMRALYPHILRALEWFDAATDPSGFLGYSGETHRGLVNQAWKDSEDSVFHANGELARGPIALCEAQGYLYAARSKRGFGYRTGGITPWLSTPRIGRVRLQPPMPAICCFPEFVSRCALCASRRNFFPAGAFVRWRRARHGTTRCRTTTALSGPTTMLCLRWALLATGTTRDLSPCFARCSTPQCTWGSGGSRNCTADLRGGEMRGQRCTPWLVPRRHGLPRCRGHSWAHPSASTSMQAGRLRFCAGPCCRSFSTGCASAI